MKTLIQVLVAAAVGLAATLQVDDDAWRLGVAAAGIAVLLARRLPPFPGVDRAGVRNRLLLLLAVLSAAQAAGPELLRFVTTPRVRVWNVYHYYLGSKYFAELGYRDLYAATLAADADGYWRAIDRVRDLGTYDVVPRAAAVARYRPMVHFSPARWQAFTRDVAALRSQRPPEGWRGIFRDRGYNPSPSWTAVGKALTRFPADNLPLLKLLCSLDLLLLGAAFTLVARTFGLPAFALVLLFFCLSPVNEGRIVGGFLQYDWLAAIAVGLCQLRRRRPVTAGLALAYATATRIFPAVLLAAAALPVIVAWIRWGRMPRRTLRLGAALAAFGLLFGLLGVALGGGVDAWHAFADNIGHHNAEHRFGQQRVGLAHLFTHDLGSLAFDESRSERRAVFERQRHLFLLAAGVLLAAWSVAIRRRTLGEAYLLGLVPLFVLTVSSRYYWAILALLPLAAAFGPIASRMARRSSAGQLAVYAGAALFALREGDRFARYSVLGMLLAALLTAWVGAYLLAELRARRRLRRWTVRA